MSEEPIKCYDREYVQEMDDMGSCWCPKVNIEWKEGYDEPCDCCPYARSWEDEHDYEDDGDIGMYDEDRRIMP